MKVLVFGSLNIDLIFAVDHTVLPGETISSSGFTKSAGGKGANQATALSKAGLEVYMAGKIGEDGRFLLDLLKSYKVNTDHVVLYEGVTGQALIQLDKNKQNAIILFSGGNGAIDEEQIRKTFEHFGKDDMIVLQNEIPHVEKIMKTARELGMKICLNPSPYNENIEKLPLDLVDIIFVNELEGSSLANLPVETAPNLVMDALLKRFPKTEIILTAGREGAFYAFGDERAKGDIIDLPVVDTVGAGDTFTGFFLAARSRGYPVADCMALACKASSITVSRPGAMASIPLAAEVFPG